VRTVLVLNGPNLNLLGTREPGIYGSATLADVERMCHEETGKLGLTLDFRQSNHEGQLIDWIQEAGPECAAGRLLGAVLNPGALTHTSLALHDAIKAADLPVIELHISNVHAREEVRRHSFVSPAARGIVGRLRRRRLPAGHPRTLRRGAIRRGNPHVSKRGGFLRDVPEGPGQHHDNWIPPGHRPRLQRGHQTPLVLVDSHQVDSACGPLAL
jgi:3-dehydroquinate dehydratase-2